MSLKFVLIISKYLKYETTLLLIILYVIERVKIVMAKAGMRRPDPSEPHGTESNHITHYKKNDVPNVPQEIQGKAKTGKKKASPIE